MSSPRAFTRHGLGGPLVALALLILPGASDAASHLATCSLNGVTVQTNLRVGYAGVGSTTAGDFDVRSDSDHIVPAAGIAASATNATSKPPAAGDVKDVAQGTVRSDFEYGVPTGPFFPLDDIKLEVAGVASALNSFNSVGNPAAAEVTASALVDFHLDVLSGVDCDGSIELEALRSLRPFELLMEINVIKDPGTPAASTLYTMLPGSSNQVVALYEGHSYQVRLDYQFLVPFGIDPPYSIEYGASISSTPTAVPISGVALAIAGLLLVIGFAVLSHWRSPSNSAT